MSRNISKTRIQALEKAQNIKEKVHSKLVLKGLITLYYKRISLLKHISHIPPYFTLYKNNSTILLWCGVSTKYIINLSSSVAKIFWLLMFRLRSTTSESRSMVTEHFDRLNDHVVEVLFFESY